MNYKEHKRRIFHWDSWDRPRVRFGVKLATSICNAYIFPSLDWHWLHVFRSWHPLRVFPRWTLCTANLFLRLTLGTLSYAWCWRHVFPRSAPVTCYSHVKLVIRLSGTLDNPYTKYFPAFTTGHIFSHVFSCAWQELQLFPRLTLVTYFPRSAPVTRFQQYTDG